MKVLNQYLLCITNTRQICPSYAYIPESATGEKGKNFEIEFKRAKKYML